MTSHTTTQHPTNGVATVILLLTLLCLFPARTPALTPDKSIAAVDDSGQQLTLTTPARRIISLAPHITELLFAAGAGHYIVGAISHSDYPPEALDIPRIGDHSGLDMEAILGLQPDLIIAWPSGNPKAALQKLQQLGIHIYHAEPRRLDDIPHSIEQLGRLTATTAQASNNARNFRQRLADLRQRYAGSTPVRVFFQVWEQPLLTINGQHLISDVIQLCGGRNIFAELPTLAPQVTIEAVIQANPAVILSGNKNTATLQHWQRWKGLDASHNGHLYAIEPENISRHSPRILQGAQQICELLEQVRQSRANTATTP